MITYRVIYCIIIYDCACTESPGHLGIAGKVWDASLLLLHYLALPCNRELLAGKRVLELGAGTGLIRYTSTTCILIIVISAVKCGLHQ
jgi:Lysine methyltransferase